VSVSARGSAPLYDFAAAGAAVRVVVSGAVLHMRASGALWLEQERVLVVADLHLEKGSAFASRGQLLPPYDTRETLRRLAGEAAALHPRTIVMLGDAFHDGGAEDRLSQEDADAIHLLAHGRSLVWVVGNHDPSPPESLPGDSVDELDLAGLRLRHEPVVGASPGEAAGHLHPCARITAGGRSVRRRCFVTDGERLVLPAFGAYAGGLNIRDAAFQGLFTRPPLAVALGARRAHAVGWWSVAGD
jgi:DNA ligase-associated metallophosphoesterase